MSSSCLVCVYAHRELYALFAVEGCRETEEVMILPDRQKLVLQVPVEC